MSKAEIDRLTTEFLGAFDNREAGRRTSTGSGS